jgi:hypothetical protein
MTSPEHTDTPSVELERVDVAGMAELLTRLEIEGAQWYAQGDRYQLCLEGSRYRAGQEHSGGQDVIGRFGCGGFAIKCTPVISAILNAAPALLSATEAHYRDTDAARALGYASVAEALEKNEANMRLRDRFLVERGLWDDFVASLPTSPKGEA